MVTEHAGTSLLCSLPPAEAEHLNTIVVAEDDTLSRKLLAKQIEKAGYRVLEAKDGNEALDLVRAHEPDVLVSDWMMPGMDGLDLCRNIKDDPAIPYVFVLILTSREKKQDLVDGLDAGADDYLQKPWDTEELLARIRAGLRIESLQRSLAQRNNDLARLTERLNNEITIVAGIQKAMLPQEIPHAEALDFTAWYLPSSECGGDYYDVLQLDETHQGFLIADVSGHGAPAMVTMALLRQNFHHIAKEFDQPGLLLEETNRLLHDHLPTDQFATMFYAIINTETLECVYSSAGHNPPLWYRKKNGETERLPKCKAFPLKLITRDACYESTTIQLEAGDRLVLYTDGIPECFNPEGKDYGMRRLESIVTERAGEISPAQLESEIVTDLMRFTENRMPEDDLTLVVLGVNETAHLQTAPPPKGRHSRGEEG